MCKETGIKQTRYTREELYTLMYHAEQEGAFVSYIRGRFCETVDDFYREISASMRFPHYFGWNWAAFDECITDLEWLKFSSLLIVLEDYDQIFKKEKLKYGQRQVLEKYLNIAAEYWTSQNVPITINLNANDRENSQRSSLFGGKNT